MNDMLQNLSTMVNVLFGENLGTTIAILIAAVTLFFTMRAVHIGKKTYHQIDREEPWKLTKIDSTNWLLERVHPITATLVGERVFPHYTETVYELVEIPVKYCQIGTSPYMHFGRGTKIVLTMSEMPVGSLFKLYYREHKVRFPFYRKLHTLKEGDYRPNITSTFLDLAAGVKEWSTPLY